MPNLINVLTVMACLAICGRLLTYRRGHDSRQRRGVGLLAWLLIASTGGQALQIILAGQRAQPSVWQLGVLLVVAFLAFRARGNVARILKVD